MRLSPRPPDNLDTRPYWEGLRHGRLMFQRCDDCREPVFHPRPLCPYCLSAKLAWEQSDGEGHIYSFTVQHVPLVPRTPAPGPLALGIIALREGFHMFAEILPGTAPLAVDLPVRVAFHDAGEGLVLPKFVVVAP